MFILSEVENNNFTVKNVFTDEETKVTYSDLVLLTLMGYFPRFSFNSPDDLHFEKPSDIDEKMVYFIKRDGDTYIYKEVITVNYGGINYPESRFVEYKKADLLKKNVFGQKSDNLSYDLTLLDKAEIKDNSKVYCFSCSFAASFEIYCLVNADLVDSGLISINESTIPKKYAAYVKPLTAHGLPLYCKEHNITILNSFNYLKDDTKRIYSKYAIMLEFEKSLVSTKDIRENFLDCILDKLNVFNLRLNNFELYYNPSFSRFHMFYGYGKTMISFDLGVSEVSYFRTENTQYYGIEILRYSKKSSNKVYASDYYIDDKH